MTRISQLLLTAVLAAPGTAPAAPCGPVVFDDRDGDGIHDRSEPGLPGIKVSDGVQLAITDRAGRYTLDPAPGRPLFVIKPAGFAPGRTVDGLPAHWRPVADPRAPALRYGARVAQPSACRTFPLRREPVRTVPLDVLVFADPQPKSPVDVGYYARDVVAPLLASQAAGAPRAHLGLTLGDVVDDDLDLYPAMIRETAQLGVPWLHVAGNHDLDFDAAADAGSLSTFHRHFGPDTFAWEEPEAVFVLLDDVIYRPGQRPTYVGGLRDEQFAFLERYLATLDTRRLLVLAVHIPLFSEHGRETFRAADRERLFALLQRFPKRLVLSGHGHVQRQVWHDRDTGWHGSTPLHEFNVGAVSGAFWSGVKDRRGIPDATMADGTPNGHARLAIDAHGDYTLAWHPAPQYLRDATRNDAMALHAPRVLRRGAYPAWGIYANVFMGDAGTRVEFSVDGGDWLPMKPVQQADPRLLAENVLDDQAPTLRGYDRSPEAQPSTHLFRGALPTDLSLGEHEVHVRYFDRWKGIRTASTRYRLDAASP